MKKPVLYLSMLAALLGTTAALCLVFTKMNNTNKASVSTEGTTISSLDVKFDDMAPGMVKTSSVSFDLTKGYSLFASFRVGEEKGLLNDYVTVRIKSDSFEKESPLKTFLSSGEISLGKDVTEVALAYYLPLDSGNETQNQSGSFWVDFIARSA